MAVAAAFFIVTDQQSKLIGNLKLISN